MGGAEGYYTVGKDDCLISENEYEYMKHIFELRINNQIEERSSQLFTHLSAVAKRKPEKIQV